MLHASTIAESRLLIRDRIKGLTYLRFFIYGLLLPLSFAPFHIPGAAILSLALFYHAITNKNNRPFLSGLFLGLGFFGLGISWIYVSIHDYGHLNSVIAALLTLLFLLYISLFPALAAVLFRRLSAPFSPLVNSFLFSSIWIISEYGRATLFTGFPWLLLGFGQFDAPTRWILPVAGVYGAGFITCLAATFLSNSFQSKQKRAYLLFFLLLLMLPLLLRNHQWGTQEKKAISTGIIQANLSMRDKWDENLFWRIVMDYRRQTLALSGTQLIVMPESAIPLPPAYLSDFIEEMDETARTAGSSVLLGIPQPTSVGENHYYNTLMSLGQSSGSYLKQHLVPFGEYVPQIFRFFTQLLGIEDANLQPGGNRQALVRVQEYPIATLICYELAYGDILRQQLPEGQWIVSISDDGWFGHSLAMYQQQQMAQVRAVQTSRYHLVSNNDGLSSIINTRGEITASLPATTSGILKGDIFATSGTTPWITAGDAPALSLCWLIILLCGLQHLLLRYRKRG